MRRRAGLVLLLVLASLLPAGPAVAQSSVAADVRGAQVLVVGAPGLRWSDVDGVRSPVLHALAERSSVGVLSVKARPAISCPVDGWLTLAAGARAEAFGLACGQLDGDRRDLAPRNRATREVADVDALAGALRGAGSCVSARGPGAALAGGVPLEAAAGANQGGSRSRSCPVLLLDAPVVDGPGEARAAGVTVVDALVAAVDAARDPGSTLLLVGVSQAPQDDRAHLQLALASGPAFGPGALRSASTRRTPYVQLIDVAPTVLDLLDVASPSSVAGRPWQAVRGSPDLDALVDLEQRATQAKSAQVPFFVVLVGGLLLALAAAAVVRSRALVEAAGIAGVTAVTGSLLAGLLPWWRAPSPLLALLAVAAVPALVAAVALPRLRGCALVPATTACTALAAVLVLDLLTGARLQIDTPTGYSPLVAGRFAGLGNVGFGVYAAAVLLSLAGLSAGRGRSRALAVVAGGGAVAVAVVGGPPWGSDVGGVLSLLPAVVVLALLRTGSRVSAVRVLLAGLAGALVVTGFALADATRPAADRTHLGRFVEQVRDGTAGSVLVRKAEAVVDLLLTNALTALLPAVVAAAVVLVVRPPGPLRRAFAAEPAWRHGVVALGLAAAVGFAANDSGPAVPALALLVAVPATLAVTGAVAARVATDHDAAEPPARRRGLRQPRV